MVDLDDGEEAFAAEGAGSDETDELARAGAGAAALPPDGGAGEDGDEPDGEKRRQGEIGWSGRHQRRRSTRSGPSRI